jgi:putative ABC transport system ATP-binding protein
MGFAVSGASRLRDAPRTTVGTLTPVSLTISPPDQALATVNASAGSMAQALPFPFRLLTINGPGEPGSMSHAAAAPESGSPLIFMRAITKVFYTDEIETHALSGVHCDIRRGEFVSISGPSGCGKSTLLAILGLLDTASSGDYRLNGRPVCEISANERATIRNREIGFIFQSFNLIGDLTVFQNVELPLTYRAGLSREARKKAVIEALERVGMAHRVHHYPSQLSGGQQQRVAVARALGGNPSILLADEPTGNLDSKNGEAVMDMLRKLHADGATICMVTHDTRYADFAERRVQLFDGRILFEDRSRPVVSPQLAPAI